MFGSALFLVLVGANCVLPGYVSVSTNQLPSDTTMNERLSQIEQHLQMREALNTLEKTKEEMIEQVRLLLDKKLESIQTEENNDKDNLKIMLLNITSEFGRTKKEIKETKNYLIQENNIKDNLRRMQLNITSEIVRTKKEIQELKNYLGQLEEQNVKDELKALKDELARMRAEVGGVKKDVLAEIKEIIVLPTNCKEIQRKRAASGIYRIQPKLAPDSFLVWCDMTTEGGGWVHLLNRFDGSQNFNLKWTDYKNGFGSVLGEHWLGLEHLYEITNSEPTELLFELVDWDLKKVHVRYDNFKIGAESEKYIIHSTGKYDGDAGDSFSSHQGHSFSTADKCSKLFKGAWWYRDCHQSHLTGRYMKNYVASDVCPINWNTFHGYKYCLKEARMMLRPRN